MSMDPRMQLLDQVKAEPDTKPTSFMSRFEIFEIIQVNQYHDGLREAECDSQIL